MGIIDKLKMQKADGRKVIIYCAGLHGILFYNVLKICGIAVDLFSDSDRRKWGTAVVDDIVCVSPKSLKSYDCVGFICVGKKHYQEIYEFVCKGKLFEVLEISSVVDDLVSHNRKLYFEVLRGHAMQQPADIFYDLHPNQGSVCRLTEEQFRNTAEHNVQSTGTDTDTVIDTDTVTDTVKMNGNQNGKKAAVYTAVFGGYDSFCLPKYVSREMDYFYVSDIKPKGLPAYFHWIDAREIIPEHISSPVKRNRFVKMHPHLFLADYSFSVYIDGNVTVKDDISDLLRGSRTGIAVFMHPMRECIYYEALSIVNFKRVNIDDVCRQMNRYFEEGMPFRYGLAEMPVIVREHMKKECVDVMETWWQEFDTESQRDQLSFMYALWKNRFGLDDLACLGYDVRGCSQIEFCGHINENKDVKNELARS